VIVCLATEGQWEPGNYARFLDTLGQPGISAFLGCALGNFQPSSPQRKACAEIFKSRAISAIAITDSPLVRGVVTAVSWFGANVRAFAWRDMAKALERVNATEEQVSRIMSAIEALRNQERGRVAG